MALTPNPEITAAENLTGSPNNAAQKKAKNLTQPTLNPVQYRAVRFVSFMLEDGKYEVSPAEFIKDAVARHLSFYQAKRGIEFPNKMLAELGKLELIPSKSGSDD